MTETVITFCSHQAAMFAVKKWHYSRSLPPPPHVKFGVWEGERFIGAIVYARGASSNLLKPYGLKMHEGAELVRVALDQHQQPVTQLIAESMRLLKEHSPGIKLIVSFADPAQGHIGGIYQAGNWIYAGQTSPTKQYRDKSGRLWHNRMVSKTGTRKVFGKRRRVVNIDECEAVDMPGKHRYLFPLDKKTRKQVERLSQSYPRREQK